MPEVKPYRIYVLVGFLVFGISFAAKAPEITSINKPKNILFIRAGEPLEGSSLMRKRRKKRRSDQLLLTGPSSLAQALGISTDLTGASLIGDKV